MTTPAKQRTAIERAGALIYNLIRNAESEVHAGRASMHHSRRRPNIWPNDHRFTKLAIQELRAARFLYDKLPRRAR